MAIKVSSEAVLKSDISKFKSMKGVMAKLKDDMESLRGKIIDALQENGEQDGDNSFFFDAGDSSARVTTVKSLKISPDAMYILGKEFSEEDIQKRFCTFSLDTKAVQQAVEVGEISDGLAEELYVESESYRLTVKKPRRHFMRKFRVSPRISEKSGPDGFCAVCDGSKSCKSYSGIQKSKPFSLLLLGAENVSGPNAKQADWCLRKAIEQIESVFHSLDVLPVHCLDRQGKDILKSHKECLTYKKRVSPSFLNKYKVVFLCGKDTQIPILGAHPDPSVGSGCVIERNGVHFVLLPDFINSVRYFEDRYGNGGTIPFENLYDIISSVLKSIEKGIEKIEVDLL